MEKYLALFGDLSTEHTYIIKSELDETILSLEENGKAIFKKHNLKTGEICEKEISSSRAIRFYTTRPDDSWGSLENIKEYSRMADQILEDYKNGEFD